MELKELVDNYRALLDRDIIVKTSKNKANNKEVITLKFLEKNIIHLAGFDKLLDIESVFYTRIPSGELRIKKDILNIIINKQSLIKKSEFYSITYDRIYYFNTVLLALLDGEHFIIDERGKGAIYSNINCNYYIRKKINCIKYNTTFTQLFFIDNGNGEFKVPVSFFTSKVPVNFKVAYCIKLSEIKMIY